MHSLSYSKSGNITDRINLHKLGYVKQKFLAISIPLTSQAEENFSRPRF